jgi:hypothetical protein
MRNPGGNKQFGKPRRKWGIMKGIFKELDRREWAVSLSLTIVPFMWCY